MKSLFPLSILMMSLSTATLADTYIYGTVGEADYNSGGHPDMYEIGLGFGSSDSFALELSYVNLGTVGGVVEGGGWLEEEADGINAALVLNIPVNEMLSLYVSGGYLTWDDTASFYDIDGYYDNFTVEGSDWNFGGGVRVEVFNGLDLEFGMTKYYLDDIKVKTVGAGIVYKF